VIKKYLKANLLNLPALRGRSFYVRIGDRLDARQLRDPGQPLPHTPWGNKQQGAAQHRPDEHPDALSNQKPYRRYAHSDRKAYDGPARLCQQDQKYEYRRSNDGGYANDAIAIVGRCDGQRSTEGED
jgi:hypothetical protein